MKKDSEEARITVDIINLCLDLDWKAAKLYTGFSKSSKDDELAAFWRDMAAEEARHINYWKQLLELAEAGTIPYVFSDPKRIRDELKRIIPKADSVLEEGGAPGMEEQFLAAYRMEFIILNSAFASLFHFLKDVTEDETPADSYNLHLEKFLSALQKHGAGSSELDLIGETLLRLWEENRKLALQNTLDPLTGVLNRQGMVRTVLPMVYFAQRNELIAGVLMIDIDGFKIINDTWGQQVGDYVLRKAADAIRLALRRSDIVCRYGGDEFLVFLPSIQLGTSSIVAEKIRQAIEETGYRNVKFTVCVGGHEGVLSDAPETRYEEMIKKADQALYDAKKAGKNKAVVRGAG
ncbi:MAG: diguanylate cyclase [bacterium]